MMRIAKIWMVALLVFAVAGMSLSVVEAGDGDQGKGDRRDLIYTCGCGEDCDCGMASTEPGTCGCGKDLEAGQVLKGEGDEAIVCTCGADCTCSLDPEDETKCACGKAVKRVSLKGTGLYFCNCGDSCGCNTVSAEPGECECGMELKKVD